MCGFAGFSSALQRKEEILERMTAVIAHRGPDSDGTYSDGGVGLGFRRLSIIDLADGDQPMTNEDKRFWIVFNGEIYNFLALREELIAAGHTFATRCDTEVLLHAYEEYGEGMLDRVRGMFAFVIWDSEKQSLFGARDFFGIKPLYYTTMEDGTFAFASEIKSLLQHPSFRREVNPAALLPYLTLQYSATEETFFRGVYKLPPAHCFTWQAGELHVRRYWDPSFAPEAQEEEAAAAALDRVVRESVEAHRISDVPIGAFLSGGVDSSYITACMMPETTFSVGFEQENFDESADAADLARRLGIRNVRRILTAEECIAALPRIQYHMDEPQSNPSAVPLYFLAQLASEEVKVVLSGEGADEIFGGYEWYADSPSLQKYKKLPAPIRHAAASVTRRLPYFRGHDLIMRGSGRPSDFFVGQARVFSEREAAALLTPAYRKGPAPLELAAPYYAACTGADEVTQKQYLDLHMWMPGDILLKADKMSMAHSLELRVPYLDRYVMDFAGKLPASLRVRGSETKPVLRRAALDTLPEEWARRPKKGFPVPIRFWLREATFASSVREAFADDATAEFFDRAKLLSMLDAHIAGSANYGRKIWTVYTFLLWYRRFFLETDCPKSV